MINSEQKAAISWCLPRGFIRETSIFLRPSLLSNIPLKWTSSFLIFARAPIGAVQPPSNKLRNSRSIPVHIWVSSSLIWAQIALKSWSFSSAATTIAPWAGAGTIQSNLILVFGVIPKRPIPAAANIAPFQLLSLSFCSLEFTLPLSPITRCVG